MGMKTTLVRTNLTADEYRQIRVIAVKTNRLVSEVAGDALRALLKGGKP